MGLYMSSVSLQIKALFQALSPLHIQKKHSSKSRLWGALLQVAIMCGLLMYGHALHIMPRTDMMNQAVAVLCEGDVNFVYTTHAATGLALAAKSFEATDEILETINWKQLFNWTQTELAVLQLAGIPLGGTYFSQELVSYATSTTVMADVLPTGTPTLTDTSAIEEPVKTIFRFADLSVEE